MNKTAFTVKTLYGGISRELNSLGLNVKTYVVYGILYDIMFNLYKPYAPKLARRLGGTELHISLVTSLPGLFAVLALIPCSILLSRIKAKQKITALFFVISRTFLPLLALTPLMPDKIRATAFVILLAAMNFPDSVSQASLQSFLGDLFHPKKRAEAIALRTKFGNMATTAALTVSCVILNFAGSTNERKIVVYQIFFIIAFLFGIVEIAVFLKLKPGSVKQEAPPFNFRESFPEIIRNRQFMTFCLLSFVFHFAYFMGFPLSNFVLVKRLDASELWVGISQIMLIITTVLSSSFWGKMIVKKGTGSVLALTSIGLAVNCLIIAVSPNPQFYAFFCLFSGISNCGLTIGVLNGLLEATPDKDRVVYVSVFQTFVNFTMAIAPLFALFVNSLAGTDTALGVTAVLRIACGVAMFAIYRKRPASV